MLYKKYRNKEEYDSTESLNQDKASKRINKYIDLRKSDFNFIDNMSFKQTVLLGILTLVILILANSAVAIYGNFYGNNIESIMWTAIFESLALGIISTFIFIFAGDDARGRYGYLGCIKITVVVSLIRGVFELVGSGITGLMPSMSRMLFILAMLAFQVVTYMIFKNKNIIYGKKAILVILLLTLFI
ncbi:hypothetical protein [Clostridium sardiniense]|uniref:hypothetical protein n=1 Tax=Clostridium sardiniense TaxID=29369 RepID=UPI003D35433A